MTKQTQPKPENYFSFCAILKQKLTTTSNVSNMRFEYKDHALGNDTDFSICIFDLGDEKVNLVSSLLQVNERTMRGKVMTKPLDNTNSIFADKNLRYPIEVGFDQVGPFKIVSAWIYYTCGYPDLFINFKLDDCETAFKDIDVAYELYRKVHKLITEVRCTIRTTKLHTAYFDEASTLIASAAPETLLVQKRQLTGKARITFGEHKPKIFVSKIHKLDKAEIGFIQLQLVNVRDPESVLNDICGFITQTEFTNTTKVHEDIYTINVYFPLYYPVWRLGEFLKGLECFCDALLYLKRINKPALTLDELIAENID